MERGERKIMLRMRWRKKGEREIINDNEMVKGEEEEKKKKKEL